MNLKIIAQEPVYELTLTGKELRAILRSMDKNGPLDSCLTPHEFNIMRNQIAKALEQPEMIATVAERRG